MTTNELIGLFRSQLNWTLTKLDSQRRAEDTAHRASLTATIRLIDDLESIGLRATFFDELVRIAGKAPAITNETRMLIRDAQRVAQCCEGR